MLSIVYTEVWWQHVFLIYNIKIQDELDARQNNF